MEIVFIQLFQAMLQTTNEFTEDFGNNSSG